MPDPSVLGGSLLVLLLIVVLLWFAFGTQRNIRKGNAILSWIQGGLPSVGRRTTLRWLGSTAVQLGIAQPNEPFREIQVLVVLEPRDVGLLWAWSRARARRDFLILRGTLSRTPTFEVEAGSLTGWTGQDSLRKLDPESWDLEDWDDPAVRVGHTPGADLDAVRRNWRELEAASGGVWRLSVRREPPHLEVHVLPPDMGSVGAGRLFGAFRALAGEVAAG